MPLLITLETYQQRLLGKKRCRRRPRKPEQTHTKNMIDPTTNIMLDGILDGSAIEHALAHSLKTTAGRRRSEGRAEPRCQHPRRKRAPPGSGAVDEALDLSARRHRDRPPFQAAACRPAEISLAAAPEGDIRFSLPPFAKLEGITVDGRGRQGASARCRTVDLQHLVLRCCQSN